MPLRPVVAGGHNPLQNRTRQEKKTATARRPGAGWQRRHPLPDDRRRSLIIPVGFTAPFAKMPRRLKLQEKYLY